MTDAVKIEKKPITVEDWHDLIAKKCKCAVEDVKATLDKHGIEPQQTIPIRKAIHFNSLKFSGAKIGTDNDRDFSFEWDELNAGLYGVLSEDNLVGKSSILKLLYSVLRGDFSSVSEPVMGWINELNAKFSVGNASFELKLLRDDLGLNADLIRTVQSTSIEEYSGSLSGLSSVVDQLLMKALEFERMFATKEGKSLVPHGWPALASALFVSGSEGAVIGDLTLSGLPQRLLQLFIGLPWISTQSRASAVLKIEESSNQEQRETNSHSSILSNTIARLQSQLEGLPDSKGLEESRVRDRQHQSNLEKKISENSFIRTQKNLELENLDSELSLLKSENLKMKRFKQYLEVDRDAGFVFRKLQPVCCPSCESTSFKSDDVESQDKQQCPLCKENVISKKPENNSDIVELQEEIIVVENKIENLARERKTKVEELDLIGKDINNYESELKEVTESLKLNLVLDDSSAKRRAIEDTIEELKSSSNIEPKVIGDELDELSILKASKTETKKMYQEKEGELFDDASSALKEMASKLGVKHLVSILWASNSLKIKIANKETTYSKLSPGEKLRFRIAASVTIAKLAAKTGQGRHPGVLFFDSPKSEEITDSDFQEIMSAITQLTKDDSDLQIFVASRVPENYASNEFFKSAKHASGTDFLF